MAMFQFATSVNHESLNFQMEEKHVEAIASTLPKNHTEKPISCSVVYNPSNNDSVFCASQLIGCQSLSVNKVIPYYRYDDPHDLKNHECVMVCGVDLSQEAIDALKTCKEVIIFTQKENFIDLDFFASSLLVMKPKMQESLGKVFDQISNTASWQAFEWMMSKGFTTTPLINYARILACKSFSIQLPVVSGTHDEFYDSDQDEIRNKDFVLRLLTAMRQALRSLSYTNEIRNLYIHKREGKFNTYLCHWQEARDMYSRCADIVRIDLKDKPGTSVLTKSISCPQNSANMLFEVARTYGGDLIVYEVVKGKKIYRLMADDKDIQRSMAVSLGAQDIWFEGPVLCAATAA